MFSLFKRNKDRQNNTPQPEKTKLTRKEKKELRPISFREFEKRYTDSGDNNIQLTKKLYFSMRQDSHAANILILGNSRPARESVFSAFLRDAPQDTVFVCFDESFYDTAHAILEKGGKKVSALIPCDPRGNIRYDPIRFAATCEDDARIAGSLIKNIPEEYSFSDSSEDAIYEKMLTAALTAYIGYVRTMYDNPSVGELVSLINTTSLEDLSQAVYEGDECYEAVMTAIKTAGNYIHKADSCLRYKMETFYSGSVKEFTTDPINSFEACLNTPGALFLFPGATPVSRALSGFAMHDFMNELLSRKVCNSPHLCIITPDMNVLTGLCSDDELSALASDSRISLITGADIESALKYTVCPGIETDYMIDESSDAINRLAASPVSSAFFPETADATVVLPPLTENQAKDLRLHPVSAAIPKDGALVMVRGEKNPVKDKALCRMN